MTNALSIFPIPCSCEGSRGNDLIPLLMVVVVLIAAHFVHKWWKGKMSMSHMKNAVVVIALVVAVGAVIAIKQNKHATREEAAPVEVAASTQPMPRLLDLGADKCVPCKMMEPILEDLKKTYAGRLQVDFIDVWKNPDPGQQYGIRVIPTQIFISADGKELFRHEGFYSKEDILAKWKEFGIDLTR